MRTLFITLALAIGLSAVAQPKNGPKEKFDPERYQAELEQFITSNACLTPTEAAAFFPVYREMMKRQHALFDQIGKYRHYKPATDEACRQAILERDAIDIQVKELQQQYHQRLLRIIPATKLFDVIKAEERFHRQSFRRMAEKKHSEEKGHKPSAR